MLRAIVFTLGFVTSLSFPRITYLIEAIVNLFLIANIAMIWTDEEK